jgi:predicted nucleic-acid-binding Zn-ribbon protein
MPIEECPKCGQKSLVKKLRNKIISENLGRVSHIANEYSLNCMNKGCGYVSEIFRVNTENKISLSWHKKTIETFYNFFRIKKK